MIRFFIGYDPREAVAYHVLCSSILRRSSVPVSFTPINKVNIPEFTRGIEDGSTEFSFSRFLTPFLAGYSGLAIYMDCDMIVRCDVAELINEIDLSNCATVVKHDYSPAGGVKFLGNTQHIYPKKNWSSMIVFNCDNFKCKGLTPDVVNNESGAFLHQFKWADESRIGELSTDWNHLVGEYEPNPSAKIVHFTLGTPCFDGYENQEYSGEWFKELEYMGGMNG